MSLRTMKVQYFCTYVIRQMHVPYSQLPLTNASTSTSDTHEICCEKPSSIRTVATTYDLQYETDVGICSNFTFHDVNRSLSRSHMFISLTNAHTHTQSKPFAGEAWIIMNLQPKIHRWSTKYEPTTASHSQKKRNYLRLSVVGVLKLSPKLQNFWSKQLQIFVVVFQNK